MVKRTSFPPWAQSAPQSSAPPASTTTDPAKFSFPWSSQPEPARIVSDLAATGGDTGHAATAEQNGNMHTTMGNEVSFHSLRPTPPTGGLAGHLNIQAAQSVWERSQNEQTPVKPPLATPSSEQSGKVRAPLPKTSTPVPLPSRYSSTPTLPMKRPAGEEEQGPNKRVQTSSQVATPQENRLADAKLYTEAPTDSAYEEATGSSPDADGDMEGITAITHVSGRPYKKYPDPINGDLMPSHGCLIPDGYKTLDELSPYIWACPVRDCRKAYPELKSLGGHFNMAHNSTAFNDNLDGTLSVVRRYKSTSKFSPAVIISQNPLSANAPPLAPAVPVRAVSDKVSDKPLYQPQLPLPPRPSSSINKAKTGDKHDNKKMIGYLHTFLDQRQTTPYHREDVAWMVKQPQLRDLPDKWLEQHHGGMIDKTHYAIAVAYLVGEELTGDEACSKALSSNGRMGGICIQLPSNMPAAAKVAFSKSRTCVGCKYIAWNGRQSNTCEWIRRPSNGAVLPEPQIVPDAPDDMIQDQVVQSVENPEFLSEEASKATSPPKEDVQMVRRGPTRAAKPEHIHVPVYEKNDTSMDDNNMASGIVPSNPRVGPAATGLEMEDWEFAPGRLENNAESWVFSGPYLTTQQPIQMADEMTFNVMTVRPGGTLHLQPEQGKLRCVSVGTGKIRVKKNGQDCFLGPNGAFKVLPGENCVIENRFYIEAFVHCTSLDNYSLID